MCEKKYLGKRWAGKGWLPVYSFNCGVHGIVQTTPSGYGNKLVCPKCLKEVNQ